ncbi:hypothetical protein A3D80_02030 [Candidatus Roizmanbacteria bacterium RIFCSPHIGHO2_02_FULL_40_13b]|uniref:Undecaprenyl-phosphate alpha-N-acetylglucosaminyl 1-phosphate transferase n=1 Tax=Candidatus Roizmanbacteria bacterium RIFCSPHIGHO2_01_FULL_39_24 TaxID=1802032 RepID=A0A1F7GLJ3_9BACT|nr:MAG: hypothetical protein A2799_01390 [Candidatus Roizmanbacteria bacterium RIFCSPHIGHO2_01_FULL_39_24]OGK26904.1 MAG: hypothetical protein A3D80_02030 [Candidatus Roizmanbacteria bacterium RIFCSPHIGHO2_02_FULL_40_13b]OGK49462.1 MAG: hypothetical protein A3A56_03605 [Candidatus Roizmanbacteria bacterium RIFCSPLOWO2_01_FULL_40_32]
MQIVSLLLSFVLSYLATPFAIKFATRFGLVDDPSVRAHPANTHTEVTPRAGGIPIFVAILITSFVAIAVNKLLAGILLGGALTVLIGILDDHYDLSPYLRFFLNFLVVGFVILFGLGTPYVNNPFGGIIRLDTVVWQINFFGIHQFLPLANLFSLIWIVALMNFVNWSKGVDGQLPGFVAVSSFFLGVLAYRFSGHSISAGDTALFSFIIAGAFLGFLPYNFFPQKIMPGYSGGSLAGFLLGVLSILSWGKFGTLILVLSIPLVDAVYVIVRRLSAGKSPFRGDALHFHHRLLEIGWGKRRIAVFYWGVSFLFGASSLFLQGFEKILAGSIVFIGLAFFILIMNRIKLEHRN